LSVWSSLRFFVAGDDLSLVVPSLREDGTKRDVTGLQFVSAGLNAAGYNIS